MRADRYRLATLRQSLTTAQHQKGASGVGPMRSSHSPCAVLIADLAGFSDLCERDGVEAGIAWVEEFREVSRAAVESHAGIWVKAWADNVAAVFPTVRQAQHCAEVLAKLFTCSSGIGWGDVILDHPPGDLWGVEVNRASRLGEDEAEAGQVLLTQAAQSTVTIEAIQCPREP